MRAKRQTQGPCAVLVADCLSRRGLARDPAAPAILAALGGDIGRESVRGRTTDKLGQEPLSSLEADTRARLGRKGQAR
jgi:hypothetical protein